MLLHTQTCANGNVANSHAQVCPLCVSDSHISSACKQGGTVSLKHFEDSAYAFRRSYWGSDARARKVGSYAPRRRMPSRRMSCAPLSLCFSDGVQRRVQKVMDLFFNLACALISTLRTGYVEVSSAAQNAGASAMSCRALCLRICAMKCSRRWQVTRAGELSGSLIWGGPALNFAS